MTSTQEDGVNNNPVTPYLSIADASDAIAFYKKAFGAEELVRLDSPDGRVLHACISINGGPIMISDEFPEMGGAGPKKLGGTPVTIHLKVANADEAVARAEAAGATVIVPVELMFWGDRYGMVEDPFGHRWSVGQPVKSLSLEELKKAAASVAVAECGNAL